MQQKEQGQRKTIFRRIGGRIVPISVATGGVVGGVKALDAARTSTVYKTKSMQIDRKLFSYMPMSVQPGIQHKPEFGQRLIAKNTAGKKMGHVFYGVTGNEAYVDWLSTKKAYRGQGVSKKLMRQAAVEMKGMGATKLSSHVVHERSAKLFGGRVKSNYWRVSYSNPRTGLSTMEAIGKREALSKVAKYKKGKSLVEVLGGPFSFKKIKQVGKYLRSSGGYPGPTIFRDVTLPKTLRRLHKPFRTVSNKLTMGIGAAAALGSIGYFATRKKD